MYWGGRNWSGRNISSLLKWCHCPCDFRNNHIYLFYTNLGICICNSASWLCSSWNHWKNGVMLQEQPGRWGGWKKENENREKRAEDDMVFFCAHMSLLYSCIHRIYSHLTLYHIYFIIWLLKRKGFRMLEVF